MRMRDAGETLAATVEHLDAIRPYVRFLAVPDTLDNLVKNGRLPQAVGTATALLDIKIQLSDDDEGNLVPAHKAKGLKRALRYCVRDVESHRPKGDAIRVSLLQARNRKGCKQLLSMVEEAGYKVDLVGTFDAGPVITTHGGIGLVAMGYLPSSLAYQA
jgi:DegV family protein with EDD domain